MSVPSLLTWLTSTLATTTTTANTAASTAASAQTDANAAAAAAATAQTGANTAAAAAAAAQTDANTAAGTAASAQTDASNALETANAAKAGFAVNPTVRNLSTAVKTDYAADLSNNKVSIFTSAAETQCLYLPVDPAAIVANTPYRILNNNNPASAGLPIHVQLNDGDGTTADDITTVAPGETCRLVYVSPTNQWFKIVGC